ncbi:MAG: hypothetical protein CM15mV47_770 [uncultured marine virus]|nr:MAG: hypothetical protein CM15mV47_770 [uncultured marine virus]
MADAVHSIQYNDMAQIRAAHAVNSAFQSGSLPDELTTGSLPSVTGFAMSFSAGFGITRAPGTSTYTGNFNGLSREQVKAMDALKHGMIPKGFVPETETGTTLVEAGWVGTGATDAGGKSLGKAGGYYTSNGSFYSVNTNTYSAYGLKESAEAAAAKAGISPEAFNAALAAARKGTATLEEGVRKAQQDKLNKAEADRQAAATEAVAKAAATASKRNMTV